MTLPRLLMHSAFAQDLSAPFRQLRLLLTRYRQLTWEMSKREITERYTGEVFGAFWVIAHPLFLIGLYVFVFAVVFEMKTGGVGGGNMNYTAYLLAGLIPWMGFQESLVKGCHSIVGNASLVKQVVFPIEVLPVKGVITALVNQAIATTLFIGYIVVSGQTLLWTYLLLPVLVGLQTLGMLGFGYALSAVNVFLRDTKDVVQLFSMAGLYLIPVFYLPEWLPPAFGPVLLANPFSHMVWCYQDILYFGQFDHPVSWGVFAIFCLASFVLGFKVFRALKPMYGNML
ncbi:MAG: ABC transporter permease [Betaproteobacteria bacterium]|nr:ABC transporter permease [Betaproteobacteria bacterium]